MSPPSCHKYLSEALQFSRLVLGPLDELISKPDVFIPLEIILDHRAQTLSAVNWCVQGLILLDRTLDAKSLCATKSVISACQASDGAFVPYPGEQPNSNALLAAASLLFSLRDALDIKVDMLDNMANAAKIYLLEAVHYEPVCDDILRFEATGLSSIYASLSSLILTKCPLLLSAGRDQPFRPGWRHKGLWKEVLTPAEREHLIQFIRACQDQDVGGFGNLPGYEAHGGHTFCGVSLFAILEATDRIPNCDSLLQWLRERCQPDGGFNGRSGKPSDCCYSFWIGASWNNLGFNVWDLPQAGIKCLEFLMSCVSQKEGGLSKSAQSNVPPLFFVDLKERSAMCDPFHTFFGCVAISIWVHSHTLKEYEWDLVSRILASPPADPFFAVAS